MESTSLRFAAAVRSLGDVARAGDLLMPSFRSPPALTHAQRSIRRHRGVPTVAVRLRQRPWSAVLADMIEGVVVANGLVGAPAHAARDALWAGLATQQAAAA